MALIKHVFMSHQGDLLPRWVEALPDAKALSNKSLLKRTITPELLWLRLIDGVEVATQIKDVHDRWPDAKVVVLSDLPNDEQGLEVFACAARGYINTHSAPALLHQVADVVEQGGLWVGESLMQRLLTATSRIARASNEPRLDWSNILTPRELEVARSVAGGASNKEIAREFDITERTVKAHVGAILEKLQVRDRLQLSIKINGLRS